MKCLVRQLVCHLMPQDLAYAWPVRGLYEAAVQNHELSVTVPCAPAAFHVSDLKAWQVHFGAEPLREAPPGKVPFQTQSFKNYALFFHCA